MHLFASVWPRSICSGVMRLASTSRFLAAASPGDIEPQVGSHYVSRDTFPIGVHDAEVVLRANLYVTRCSGDPEMSQRILKIAVGVRIHAFFERTGTRGRQKCAVEQQQESRQ